MAAASVQFSVDDTNVQISELQNQHQKLEQVIEAIPEDPQNGKQLLQQISSFIKALLTFAINIFGMFKGLDVTMNSTINRVTDTESKLSTINSTYESMHHETQAMNVQITAINADIANIKAVGVSQADHKQLSDGIKQEVDLIKKAIETLTVNMANTGGPNYNTITSSKAIMEFKAISNLRSLKTKGEFRLWNERLLSALDQARPGLHQMLEAGTLKLDIGEKYMDDKKWDEQLTLVHGSQRAIKPYLEYHEVRRDLHCLLQDKCEDPEGLSRI